MSCVVLVPIYKNFEKLSENEILSLEQLLVVLKNYPIVFIGPERIQYDVYLSFCRERGIVVAVELFSNSFFDNVVGYNLLLQEKLFYKRFSSYQFMLIYQLDAFVFRDELEFWCSKNYDFIGAPWFKGWDEPSEKAEIIGVGNGGLSLRKTSMFLKLLRKIRYLKFLHRLYTSSHLNKLIEFRHFLLPFKMITQHYFDHEVFESILKGNHLNEDYFWAIQMPKCFHFMNIAPINEAIKFSFEVNPRLLYDLNNKMLPFGCHAWERYDVEFWKEFTHIKK